MSRVVILNISLIYYCSPVTLIINSNLFYLLSLESGLSSLYLQGSHSGPVQATKNLLCISAIVSCLTMSQLATLQFFTIQQESSFQNPNRSWDIQCCQNNNALRIMPSSPASSLTSLALSSSPKVSSLLSAFAYAFSFTQKFLPSFNPISSAVYLLLSFHATVSWILSLTRSGLVCVLLPLNIILPHYLTRF